MRDFSRSKRGRNLPMTAVHALREEIADLTTNALQRSPAKVIALKLGTTARHIDGLKRREHGPSAAAFLLLAQDNAELRDWVAQFLRLNTNGNPRARKIAEAVQKVLGEESYA